MKELFWDLREALRRENTLVSDQGNMNHFLWSHMPRIRHEYEHGKMAYSNNGGTPALKRASQSLETTPKALARMSTCCHRGSLLPTSWENPQCCRHTPRLSKLSGYVGSGCYPKNPIDKIFEPQK